MTDDKEAVAAIANLEAVYDGPERRIGHDEWRSQVNKRLDDGADTMRGLKADIADNTAATKLAQDTIQTVKDDTSELVSLLKSFQGAFAVLSMIGKFARPMGYIIMLATAVVGLWTAVKSGVHPPK